MHRYRTRVYYEDTDAGGVMYHASYLRMAERARTEALRAAGVPHSEMSQDHGVMFMVRRAEIEYLRPARLDEEIVVETRPKRVGAATAVLRQDFLADGRVLAEMEIELACVRMRDGRPSRIPERWRGALAPEQGRSGAGAPTKEGAD